MLCYIKLLFHSVRPVRFTYTKAIAIHLGFRIQKAGRLDSALDFGVKALKHKTRPQGQYSAVVNAFSSLMSYERYTLSQ